MGENLKYKVIKNLKNIYELSNNINTNIFEYTNFNWALWNIEKLYEYHKKSETRFVLIFDCTNDCKRVVKESILIDYYDTQQLYNVCKRLLKNNIQKINTLKQINLKENCIDFNCFQEDTTIKEYKVKNSYVKNRFLPSIYCNNTYITSFESVVEILNYFSTVLFEIPIVFNLNYVDTNRHTKETIINYDGIDKKHVLNILNEIHLNIAEF